MKCRENSYLLMLSPWMANLFFLILFPLVSVGCLSFCTWDLFGAPRWVGLANYREIFVGDGQFWQSLKVTVLYVVIYVPTEVAGGLALGLLLHHIGGGQNGERPAETIAAGIVRTSVYLPTVLSGVALTLLGMWLFQPESGIVNKIVSFFGLPGPRWLLDPNVALITLYLMSLWGLGRSAFLILAGRQMIPKDLFEAASIDGAGILPAFFRITLPCLFPTLAFNWVLGIAASFQIFTGAYVATSGGPLDATLFYVLYIYQKGFKELQFGYAAALSVMLFIFSLGISTALARLLEDRA